MGLCTASHVNVLYGINNIGIMECSRTLSKHGELPCSTTYIGWTDNIAVREGRLDFDLSIGLVTSIGLYLMLCTITDPTSPHDYHNCRLALNKGSPVFIPQVSIL